MSLTRKVGRLQYRFYDRMRHPKSFEIAAEPDAAADFEALRGHHYCLLVTFKRSGEPVPTPVLFGLEGEKVYFRTEEDIAKVKRLRRDHRVRVGPCNWRAKPLGPLADGTARILSGAEADHAQQVLQRSYTRPMRVYEGTVDMLPVDLLYVEVTPSAGESREGVAA
jgi:uncharacterized protein